LNDKCFPGQSENPEVNAERSNAQLDTGVGMGKLDDEHEVVFGLSFLQHVLPFCFLFHEFIRLIKFEF